MNREILLKKLENLGFRGPVLEWLKSYLSDRTQRVSFNNCFSKEVASDNGVPQGSVLGPFLFLLYMNDLLDACRYSKPYLCADDTCLLFPKQPSCEELNKEIKSIVGWLHSNKLEINHSKSFDLISCKHNSTGHHGDFLLDFYHRFKYLGIITDSHITFEEHMEFVCRKLPKFVSILARLR